MSASPEAPLGADLARELGIRFEDPALLELALTHRSFAFEQGGIATNERLEFLGDAVLALVVTDEIFHAHPDAAEGRLAKLRSAAVKTGSLARMARRIGLGRYVRLGRGETNSGGADKDSILADTFEALLGAYYLDQGYAAVDDLVRGLFRERLAELAGRGAALDYKTSLQEYVAATFESMPHYAVTDEGPDHEKVFTAEVSVAGRVVGHGTGRSKKEAEQEAAREAYLLLTTEG
ncbi:MAG: ribonuclease III [Actinobacteria bacterium]|nr:ribonuclease III [Actinomycetota bacterium]